MNNWLFPYFVFNDVIYDVILHS